MKHEYFIRKFTWIFLFLTCIIIIAHTDPLPNDDYLHASGNRILDDQGNEAWLTGINWYGFETHINVAQGLTDRNYKDILNITAELGFNVLRIPLSLDIVYKWSQGNGVSPTDVNTTVNPEFTGKTSLFIFEAIITHCKNIGLKVILDIHNVMPGQNEHPLWYDGSHPVSQWLAAWRYLATRYKNDDTVIAMDLKNEPHGNPYKTSDFAKWDGSSDQNNFRKACEDASSAILGINPGLLVLVEGIEVYPEEGFTWETAGEYNFDHNWWGGNLRGAGDYPVNIGSYQNQLIYSPHDYGPGVYSQPWFEGSFNKDTLLNDVWRPNWFYLHEQNTAPLLIGEWGGPLEGDNLTWMNAIRDFIKEHRLNHTFWCLNRSSIGTEGIFTGGNWESIDQDKMNFLKPAMWRDTEGKFVGLDHQLVLACHKPDYMDTHTNITLVNGGSIITPEPTPEPTPVPTSYYYGGMKVLYKCGDTNSSTSQIKPQFNIVNTGDETITIGGLTVHYYYTKTGVMQEVFNVDYAPMGSSGITGTFYDGYMEIGFTGSTGTLSPSGGETGEIQLRINRTNHEPYDQTDDYSFDPSKDTYEEWDHILLFLDGELVWGIPPGGATPAPTPAPTQVPTETPGSTPEQTGEPSPTIGGPSQMQGDVNSDNSIDIVDALLIAQYYVGYTLKTFNPLVADVNNDDEIDIVDALLVAQYYVGILPGLGD
ncbi:MAG: cellulase family glycosylhydrolase [Spirochaetales bacterium]|nr:cellulase family glycosylhydrolase [Spirochaetales bacterium]